MDSNLLAYLAGAMDSDGYFTIKKSTYHIRVRKDASNPVYSEKLGLHQVTPDIPFLLKDTFGGTVHLGKPQTPNSKPLYRFIATDKVAANICQSLFPYLRVKKQQAAVLMELRESKKAGYGQLSYWFQLEFPNWREMELITPKEAARVLGHKNQGSVSKSISNGSLLALPYDPSRKEVPRIPKLLVERMIEIQGKDGRSLVLPPQLVEWRERLHQRVRELNKIGINGTPIYHRTGHYTPA